MRSRAVGEVAVVDRDDVRDVVRVGGAVEAEALARGEVVIRWHAAPQVDGRRILAHLLGLGEDRKPEQHADALGVQVLADLAVNILVQAPADDDLPHRDEGADGVDAGVDLLSGVSRGVPGAERDLDDIIGLGRRLALACRQGQQAR